MEGPLIVLAGAGTGKTRVLTTKLSKIIIDRLASPYEILTVTFTNKAANEMLGDFYKANPNKYTAVKQAGLLREWIAYPGDNSLAITQLLFDGQESIVTGAADDMKALQEELAEEVSDMLPN